MTVVPMDAKPLVTTKVKTEEGASKLAECHIVANVTVTNKMIVSVVAIVSCNNLV